MCAKYDLLQHLFLFYSTLKSTILGAKEKLWFHGLGSMPCLLGTSTFYSHLMSDHIFLLFVTNSLYRIEIEM
jgi:hypothetical protein